MKYLKTIGISLVTTTLILWGFLNIPLSVFESKDLGSDITTISGSDTVQNALKVITNTNFANLNAGKIENATTSLPLIITLAGLTTANALTSASALATIGTIGTGVWEGTDIGIEYGGTGSSTLLSKRILFGNGTKTMLDVGFGSNGEFLTSAGDSLLPTWTSASFDETGDFNLTGLWTWDFITIMASSSIGDLIADNLTVASTTINEWATASTSIASKGYVDNRGCATGTYEHPKNTTGNLVITHDLGFIPTSFQIDASGRMDGTVDVLSYSRGVATSTESQQLVGTVPGWSDGNSVFLTSDFIIQLKDDGASTEVRAKLSAINMNTFTLNWDINGNDGNSGNRFFTWKVCK